MLDTARIERAAAELRSTGRYGSEAVETATDAAPVIARIIRDDIVMAWQEGRIADLLDVERMLNERIAALSGRPTTTGDTT